MVRVTWTTFNLDAPNDVSRTAEASIVKFCTQVDCIKFLNLKNTQNTFSRTLLSGERGFTLGFIPPVVLETKIFGDKWHTLLCARYSACHPTNSVKALKDQRPVTWCTGAYVKFIYLFIIMYKMILAYINLSRVADNMPLRLLITIRLQTKARSTPATMSKQLATLLLVASTLLPFLATMSNVVCPKLRT